MLDCIVRRRCAHREGGFCSDVCRGDILLQRGVIDFCLAKKGWFESALQIVNMFVVFCVNICSKSYESKQCKSRRKVEQREGGVRGDICRGDILLQCGVLDLCLAKEKDEFESVLQIVNIFIEVVCEHLRSWFARRKYSDER